MSDNVLDVLNDIVSTSSALGSAILKQVSAGTQPGKQDQLVSMAKQAMGITTDMLPVKIGLGQGPTVSVDLSKILPARSLLDQLLIQAAVMGIHVVADAASSAISSSGVGAPAMPSPGVPKAGSVPVSPFALPSGTAVPSGAPAPALKGPAILEVARQHIGIGQKYGHADVDYTDPFWRGEMDCSEFASYCVWRAFKILYGVELAAGTTEPIPGRFNVNSFTGFWKKDALTRGKIIDSDLAFSIPGALVLRYPPEGEMGHIAICLGDNVSTYEAAGTNIGIIKGSRFSSSGEKRRWDVGVLIPGVDYGIGVVGGSEPRIYRAFDPPKPYDEVVEQIQRKLVELHFLTTKDVDGEFGPVTSAAVVAFQRSKGFIEDGEVGPDTGRALGLGQYWGDAPTQPAPAVDGGPPAAVPGAGTVAVPTPVTHLLRSRNFTQIKQEYLDMWATANVRPNWKPRATQIAGKMIANRARYEAVASKIPPTPWYFISVIHQMEGDMNFNTHLHNGDSLSGRTIHVPAGRPPFPPANGARYTWEESAYDALTSEEGINLSGEWDIARMLWRFETFNGFGSRLNFGVPTAYLWSGTDYYEKGKYRADHDWDPNLVSDQVGCVPILRALIDQNAISLLVS